MNDIIELPATTGAGQSLVGQLVKAEIDTQIATAHQYPRSVAKVVKNVLSLVTISADSAAECGYALPRGGKPILGPSIRLAEIVAGQWGNCRVGARVVHVDRFEKYLEAEGVFHDLETNTATTARVRRRIVDSRGNLYNDDMIVVTGNAACAIAKRNAILAGVPKAVWNEAYETALRTVKGDVKTLPERRAAAFKAFHAFGVTPDMIFDALDVGGEEDIGLDQIATLGAMHKAIKDGEQQVEEYFPALKAAGGKPKGDVAKGTAAKLADIAKGGGKEKDEGKPEYTPTAPAEQAKDAPQGDAVTAPADEGAAPASDAKDRAAADPEDAAKAAYRRGRNARGRGMKADACPPDLRKDEALAEAWMDGWKDADAEAEGGGE